MYQANDINTKNKINDRLSFLLKQGCIILNLGRLQSRQFQENLEFIDSLMPNLLGKVLLLAYLTGIKKVSSVIDVIENNNPLCFTNKKMYEYKMKKFLCACALGMTPEKEWEGKEDATGGYIVVKHDGSVLCYNLYNRNEFEQYLFDYTYFDSSSTSRYAYAYVYKDNEKYYIKLNLKVRFL